MVLTDMGQTLPGPSAGASVVGAGPAGKVKSALEVALERRNTELKGMLVRAAEEMEGLRKQLDLTQGELEVSAEQMAAAKAKMDYLTSALEAEKLGREGDVRALERRAEVTAKDAQYEEAVLKEAIVERDTQVALLRNKVGLFQAQLLDAVDRGDDLEEEMGSAQAQHDEECARLRRRLTREREMSCDAQEELVEMLEAARGVHEEALARVRELERELDAERRERAHTLEQAAEDAKRAAGHLEAKSAERRAVMSKVVRMEEDLDVLRRRLHDGETDRHAATHAAGLAESELVSLRQRLHDRDLALDRMREKDMLMHHYLPRSVGPMGRSKRGGRVSAAGFRTPVANLRGLREEESELGSLRSADDEEYPDDAEDEDFEEQKKGRKGGASSKPRGRPRAGAAGAGKKRQTMGASRARDDAERERRERERDEKQARDREEKEREREQKEREREEKLAREEDARLRKLEEMEKRREAAERKREEAEAKAEAAERRAMDAERKKQETERMRAEYERKRAEREAEMRADELAAKALAAEKRIQAVEAKERELAEIKSREAVGERGVLEKETVAPVKERKKPGRKPKRAAPSPPVGDDDSEADNAAGPSSSPPAKHTPAKGKAPPAKRGRPARKKAAAKVVLSSDSDSDEMDAPPLPALSPAPGRTGRAAAAAALAEASRMMREESGNADDEEERIVPASQSPLPSTTAAAAAKPPKAKSPKQITTNKAVSPPEPQGEEASLVAPQVKPVEMTVEELLAEELAGMKNFSRGGRGGTGMASSSTATAIPAARPLGDVTNRTNLDVGDIPATKAAAPKRTLGPQAPLRLGGGLFGKAFKVPKLKTSSQQ